MTIMRGDRIALAVLLLLLPYLGQLHAQNRLPVIHAGSKVVDILDGEDVRTGDWYIMPEKKPDTYWVSIPRRPHRVMFRTDRDTIAFDTKYGEIHDFIIVLGGRDSEGEPDQLGRHERRGGRSRNTLTVSGLTWGRNAGFSVADNFERDEDGLLGNSPFMGRMVEIDYDRSLMIIHDMLRTVPPGYTRQPIILDGAIPFLKARIVAGSRYLTDWYMFDTGNTGLVRLSHTMAERRRLGDKLRTAFNPFKKTFVFPQFIVGDHAFGDIKGVVHGLGPAGRFGGLIGNALLKRYNVILDNRNGDIYLRPNSLMKTPL